MKSRRSFIAWCQDLHPDTKEMIVIDGGGAVGAVVAVALLVFLFAFLKGLQIFQIIS